MQKIRLKKEPRLDAKLAAFPYQLEAVRAVRDLEYAAIFHEQGLGKTKIAIDLAAYWLSQRAIDTAVFVVKKGLLANWLRELRMHTFIEPRVLSQDRRVNSYVFNSPARAVLTHYEVLRTEQERFALFLRAREAAAILDEATKIKNPAAELTKAAFALAPLFRRRVVMTGTPVANRPYDIWALIWFLDQGRSLGNDFEQFRQSFDISAGLAHDEVARARFESGLRQVFARIAGFSVRELKDSGLVELPQKTFQSVTVTWEPRQYELYREIRDSLRAVVIREGVPTEENAKPLLKRLLRLVQVAANPRLVDASYAAEPGKLAPLRDIVELVCRAREKCVVWSSFTANVDWLTHELREFGAARLHGGMAMAARNRAVVRFMEEPTCRVLIATPGAAKEGLTLTAANHVIFYDRSFSLDDYIQAQDRIHRISQTRTCTVTNLLMEESIDQWVDVLLDSKQLAAQLAQGDIALDTYRARMSYDFGTVLREVLNIGEGA
jgi:SNF2 family DNA or RNA helicase